MSIKPISDARQRLQLLRKLLEEGSISTQEELVDELYRKKFDVTQSTISRDLRRIGAIKAVDSSGTTVYRLPEDSAQQVLQTRLEDLILDIDHNGMLIVIKTTPGAANLIARTLDLGKLDGVLGTIAGDDVVFIAPTNAKKIKETMEAVIEELAD